MKTRSQTRAEPPKTASPAGPSRAETPVSGQGEPTTRVSRLADLTGKLQSLNSLRGLPLSSHHTYPIQPSVRAPDTSLWSWMMCLEWFTKM